MTAEKKKAQKEVGPGVGVSVRLPAEMLKEIDRLADQERRTRGNMVRILLEDALEHRKGG